MESVVLWALAAATIAKVAVDLVRMAIDTPPKWVSPSLAVVFGVAVVVGLMLAEGQTLNVQLGAIAALAGVLAGGTAVGLTELQRRT